MIEHHLSPCLSVHLPASTLRHNSSSKTDGVPHPSDVQNKASEPPISGLHHCHSARVYAGGGDVQVEPYKGKSRHIKRQGEPDPTLSLTVRDW